MSFERLYTIFKQNSLAEQIDNTFYKVSVMADHPSVLLNNMAENISRCHGLSAHIVQDAVQFYSLSSRAAKPACVVVSRNHGHFASPSPLFVRRTAHALIQVFEVGADDTDEWMERGGEGTTAKLAAQDRFLLY